LSEQNLLNRPSGLSLIQIAPKTIRVHAFHLVAIDVPIKIVTTGSLSKPLTLIGIQPSISTVRLLVPRVKRSDYSEIRTEPVNLSEIKKSGDVRIPLLLPDHTQLTDARQSTISLTITLGEKK
jgi:diadenylate cyclase